MVMASSEAWEGTHDVPGPEGRRIRRFPARTRRAEKRMSNYRRSYYNVFSKIYDRFVALHSSDARGDLRQFLAGQVPVCEGETVLDLCTGTASLLPLLSRKVGVAGRIYGVDFSQGMLGVGRARTRYYENIQLVEADVAELPFHERSIDAVTCSYAFYELKGATQDKAIQEIKRVLKPRKAFLLMEHDLPDSAVIRTLFYIRLASMGARRALSILRHEEALLRRHFTQVDKMVTANGRTKVFICRNYAR